MTYTKTITLLRKINIVPRWFIFLLDMACGFVAIFFALLLRNNLIISPLKWTGLMQIVMLVGFVNTLVFASLRTYRGIVRFTGLQDAFRVFLLGYQQSHKRLASLLKSLDWYPIFYKKPLSLSPVTTPLQQPIAQQIWYS